MDEGSARAWIEAHFGATGLSAMHTIVDSVMRESMNQNLVAPSTLSTIWTRHVVDSAQLLKLADPMKPDEIWIDVGSGAGFPGLVIAGLSSARTVLVEPRKRRASFLTEVIDALGIAERAEILCDRIESVQRCARVVSARAVAPLADIFAWSSPCADFETQWILPKGRSARDEVASAQKLWHGTFHVEHSVTDPNSLIVLASGVSRR